MNISDLDQRYSDLLNGKRLICEAPFDFQKIEEMKQTLIPLGAEAAWKFPSAAAVVTAGMGVYYYREGDFWSIFQFSVSEQRKWGEEFEKFLDAHPTLETFRFLVEEDRAHRFLAPILGHAGIPHNCLPDFFSLVTKYGEPDLSSADLLYFFSTRQDKMSSVDRPVQRFLLHGGEIAEEFLTRFLDLWGSRERGDGGGGTFGLPRRVVEEFQKWFDTCKPARHPKEYARQPTPQQRLSPQDRGVYLYLPQWDSPPEGNAACRWKVNDKECSIAKSHELLLPLDQDWVITLGETQRTIKALCKDNPILFFNPTSGIAISNPQKRRLPVRLWAVFKEGVEFDPPPQFTEELISEPRYRVAVFYLDGRSHLTAGAQSFEICRPFFQWEEDPIVKSVTTDNGYSIFHKTPSIRWEGKANLSLAFNGKEQGNMDIEAKDLPILLDKPGIYQMKLRGPLGENVLKDFLLLSGFAVKHTPEIGWPGTKRIGWEIKGEKLEIFSDGGGIPPFSTSAPEFRFKVITEGKTIPIRAKAPSLKWAVFGGTKNHETMETKPISLSINDLREAAYPKLICNLEIPCGELFFSLENKRGNRGIFQAKHSTIGGQNAWSFDLRQVRDDVESTGKAGEYHLTVARAGGEKLFTGKILSVSSSWEVKDLKGGLAEEGFHVKWREGDNRVEGRWIGLVPLWRPWEGAVLERELPVEEKNSCVLKIPCSGIRPGPYLLRAVYSPWGKPDWISAHAASGKKIEIKKPQWRETFLISSEEKVTVQRYFESLLACWMCNNIPKPPPPCGLSSDEIKWFLDQFANAHRLKNFGIPRDGSGSLNIFVQNPMATTEAVRSLNRESFTDLWNQVLPSYEIILLEPSQADKEFILKLAFSHDTLHNEGQRRDIKHKCRQCLLSEPLKVWHKKLGKGFRPPPDDLIFLCEKHQIFKDKSAKYKQEYEKLKGTSKNSVLRVIFRF